MTLDLVTQRVPVFAANWKMNKFVKDSAEYVEKLSGFLTGMPLAAGKGFEVVLAAPATHLTTLSKLVENTPIQLAAQNCGTAKFGAYTGETSRAVLREIGCDWVILGHSERRHVYGETEELVQSRLEAALAEELDVILCIGETQKQRKDGKTFDVVKQQLEILTHVPNESWEHLLIAYEPVWAIGTGENATPAQAQEVQQFIRTEVAKYSTKAAPQMRILYGGSVKPDNSGVLMEQKDVDGLLVGGASLEATMFASVIKNGLQSRA